MGLAEKQRVRSLYAQSEGRGDLDSLLSQLYPRVERIVRGGMGRHLRSVVEVEDITQETFLELLRGLHRFELRSDTSFLDWIVAIARNRIRRESEYWSRAKRDAGRLSPSTPRDEAGAHYGLLEPDPSSACPVTSAARKECRELLERAMNGLPPQERQALVLCHYAGLSHAEIAHRLGRPTEAAARELCRRARARLARVLRHAGLET